MELVVTGLSKNPFYTAKEKKECVEWYKDYFTQFTPEELQAMETAKMEPIAEAQEWWTTLVLLMKCHVVYSLQLPDWAKSKLNPL